MPKHETVKANVTHGLFFSPVEFNQMFQTDDNDFVIREVNPFSRHIVKRVCFRVVKPLTRSVQFFKDVFNHAKVFVHR